MRAVLVLLVLVLAAFGCGERSSSVLGVKPVESAAYAAASAVPR